MISIRERLRSKLLPAIAITSALLLAVISALGAQEFRNANEARLTHIAQLVLGLSTSLPLDGGRHLIDPDLYERLELSDYLILVRRDGTELYASPHLLSYADRPTPDATRFTAGDETYDLLNVEDQQLQTRVTVGVIADEVTHSLLEIVLITTVLFLVGAAFLWRSTLRAIRSALAPLHAFAGEMEQRHSGNLAPLEISRVPEELTNVASAINGLMSKVDKALTHERAFVANAAHELRTPLAGIVAQIDAMSAASTAEERADGLGHIRAAALRSNRMVSQLLDHARALTLHDNATISSRFDLAQLVQESVANHAQQAIDRDVDLGIDFAIQDSVVDYPRDLLQIILENLIDNAVKYCGAPGLVSVSLHHDEGDCVVVRIEDNGAGLSADQFRKACGRFERFSSQEDEGYGLGLALVADLSNRLDIQLDTFASSLGGFGVRLSLRALSRDVTLPAD